MTIPWNQAETLANRIIQKLSPTCEKMKVCGSIRRHAATVKDIDIVCLPINDRIVLQRDLWNHPTKYQDNNLLLNRVNDHKHMRGLELIKINGKEKRITIQHMEHDVNIELYLVDRLNQFGMAVLVRTGPHQISKRVMSYALERHWHITDYELHTHEKGGKPGRRTKCTRGDTCTAIAHTPTEQLAFSALGLDYPHPAGRVPYMLEELIIDAHERRFVGVGG